MSLWTISLVTSTNPFKNTATRDKSLGWSSKLMPIRCLEAFYISTPSILLTETWNLKMFWSTIATGSS